MTLGVLVAEHGEKRKSIPYSVPEEAVDFLRAESTQPFFPKYAASEVAEKLQLHPPIMPFLLKEIVPKLIHDIVLVDDFYKLFNFENPFPPIREILYRYILFRFEIVPFIELFS